jgi:hypothetical protein
MYRLYTFSQENGEGEFVVISELKIEEVIAEYETARLTLSNMMPIGDDAISFPRDRPLMKVA